MNTCHPKNTLQPLAEPHGFTLIELILYLGIIGIVMVSLTLFSLSIITARNKNFAIQEIQANARLAIDLISEKTRSAIGVDLPTSIFDTHPGKLVLSMSNPAQNPTVIEINAGVLTIQEGTGPPVPITGNLCSISNLTFKNLTGSAPRASIQTQLTLEFNNSEQTTDFKYDYSVQTSTTLRQ